MSMMLKVQRRNGFSDRNHIKAENTEIQITSLDERTRNQLFSLFTELFRVIKNGISVHREDFDQDFCRFILRDVYTQSLDARKHFDLDYIIDIISTTIEKDEYDSVLTLIEAIAQYWDEKYRLYFNGIYQKSVYEMFNSLFEKEYVGYRFIGTIIVRISDQNEIDTINESLDSPDKDVRQHIEKATALLSDRDKPDYENSIKESISAVEALCEIVLKTTGAQATLGDMLKKLETNGLVIHPALKEAFIKLYGYTSDANGIRHAGNIGGPASTFEEAKFMLVSCCAFINYVKAVQAKSQKSNNAQLRKKR